MCKGIDIGYQYDIILQYSRLFSTFTNSKEEVLNMPNYAGFWRRFAAHLIDGIVLGIPVTILVALLGVGTASLSNNINSEEGTVAFVLGFLAAYSVVFIITFIGSWLYYSLMESSSNQATLGKMALGIIVTDLEGNRISFGKATGRYFSKSLLPGLIAIIPILGWIGSIAWFVTAAFTEKKQAVHDMIANTLVIKK
jgi:uncharacterized RDD family membrane protein YckC